MSHIQRSVSDDYFILQKIGEGASSTVFQCENKISSEMFAVKMIRKEEDVENCHYVENEIRILRRCSHQNIIRLIDVYETDSELSIVLELVRGGDLFVELDNGPFNEMKAHGIFCQVVEAVRYLHSMQITHRDLKLENILMSGRNVKLTDFGLSKLHQVNHSEFMRSRCGTLSYIAPEVLAGEKYTSSVDIWALGVMLYVMLFLQFPFTGDVQNMYNEMRSGDLSYPTSISRDLKSLIRGLLTMDPTERITLQGIMSHPWIKRYSFKFAPMPVNSTVSIPNPLKACRDLGSSIEETPVGKPLVV